MKKLLQSARTLWRRPKNVLAGLMLSGLSFAALSSSAQSMSYFYKDNQSGYTIAAIQGTTNYIAAGTIYDANGQNKIHLVQYDANGWVDPVWGSYYIDDPNADDRAVKVISINSNVFAVVSFHQDLIGIFPRGQIRVAVMDMSWNILAEERFEVSSGTSMDFLYPLDAVWDATRKQFFICGTAVKGKALTPTSSKQAFVMTVDVGFPLKFNTLAYYDKPDFYNTATRIVPFVNNAGTVDFYLTGSVSVDKGAGTVMAIRNMTIDGNNLGLLLSEPLFLTNNPKTSENSVDMIITKGKFGVAYNVLVNYQELTSWGVIRLDPNTLLPYKDFEDALLPGVAYEFMESNGSSQEAIVAGMGNPSNANAEPFHAYLDFSTYPTTMYHEVEYPTIVGNNNGTVNFWTMGDFYAENNGYALPFYLHKFSARQDPGSNTDFGILAPIMEPNNIWLNSKFTWADVNSKTQCPFINNPNGLQNTYSIKTDPAQPWGYEAAKAQGSALKVVQYPYINYDKCTNGYYKLGNTNSTDPEDGSSLVYPNPSDGALNLNLSGYGTEAVSVQLFDLTGKHIATVYEGTAREHISYQIPAGIAKGLYMLSIEANGKDKRIEKLSIQ